MSRAFFGLTVCSKRKKYKQVNNLKILGSANSDIPNVVEWENKLNHSIILKNICTWTSSRVILVMRRRPEVWIQEANGAIRAQRHHSERRRTSGVMMTMIVKALILVWDSSDSNSTRRGSSSNWGKREAKPRAHLMMIHDKFKNPKTKK